MPFWYIVDNEGNLVGDAFDSDGESLACPTGSESVEEFVWILDKTSNLTLVDVKIIRKTFIIEEWYVQRGDFLMSVGLPPFSRWSLTRKITDTLIYAHLLLVNHLGRFARKNKRFLPGSSIVSKDYLLSVGDL